MYIGHTFKKLFTQPKTDKCENARLGYLGIS